MSTIKPVYTASATITVTVASLASGSARASAAVDNSSNLFDDALVTLKIKTNAAGTSATGYCNIYAFASSNAGTYYSDGASGSDSAQTLTKNARLIGVMSTIANATTYQSGPYSIAQAFGSMPRNWGIIVENQSGAALDSTGGNHDVNYMGVQYQSV
jgi:hypothetical protein